MIFICRPSVFMKALRNVSSMMSKTCVSDQDFSKSVSETKKRQGETILSQPYVQLYTWDPRSQCRTVLQARDVWHPLTLVVITCPAMCYATCTGNYSVCIYMCNVYVCTGCP